MAAKGKFTEWLTDEGLLKIEGWARDGLVDKQIAHNIGITEQTLYKWQSKYPEFKEALKRGKEIVDRQVENALLKKALGYEVSEVKKIVDNKGYSKVIETTRHIQPDVGAICFWLKNRKPEAWRDKPVSTVESNEVSLAEAIIKASKERNKLNKDTGDKND